MRRINPPNRLREFLLSNIQQHVTEVSQLTKKELDKVVFRTSKSLRLTDRGFRLLSQLFQPETFSLDGTPLAGKELLALKHFVPWPYYLTKTDLFLFDSKGPFYLALNGSDVHSWLMMLYNQNY